VRRLHVARAELEGIYQHDSMKYVPLIVLANKQDSKDALTGEQIAGKLDLLARPEGSYYIIPCCAINGDGITDAFTILAQMIRTQKKTHRLKFS
jgi:signal recognition particle receptor subunit beta